MAKPRTGEGKEAVLQLANGILKMAHTHWENHNHTLNYIHTVAPRKWNGFKYEGKPNKANDRVEISKQKRTVRRQDAFCRNPSERPLNMTLHHARHTDPKQTQSQTQTQTQAGQTEQRWDLDLLSHRRQPEHSRLDMVAATIARLSS